jgi:hypothetical protein
MMKKTNILMMLSVLLLTVIINIYANNNSNLHGPDLNKQSKWLTILETGVVSGFISDCNTGIGISNVLVKADDGINHYEAESDQYGNYELIVDAGTLLAEKVADSTVVLDLNTVELDVPVPIDVSKELWVGYTIFLDYSSTAAAVDAGPAVAGYGDKVSLDGVSWDNLSDFGLDYNWNIGVQLEELNQSYSRHIISNLTNINDDSKSKFVLGPIIKGAKAASSYSERSFDGFNIYSKVGEDNEYEFLEFVPYIDGQSAYCYKVNAEDEVQTGKCYFYQVTSVNSSANDQCESDPGTTTNGEDYAYACVTGISEAYAPLVTIYPNPASNTVTIKSMSNINKIVISNYFGQTINVIKPSQRTSVILNTTSFPNGVYLVQIDTDNGVQTRKLSIAR